MTETPSTFASPEAQKRLRKRRAADVRFRWYGIAAIALAMTALIVLLGSILTRAASAATQHVVVHEILLDEAKLAPPGKNDPKLIARNVEGAFALIRDSLTERFPEARDDRALRRELSEMHTRLAALDVAKFASTRPDQIGRKVQLSVPINDDVDLYLKGRLTPENRATVPAGLRVSALADGRFRLDGANAFAAVRSAQAAQAESRGADPRRSILLTAGASTGRLTLLSADAAELDLLTGDAAAFSRAGLARLIALPEDVRAISDQQIAWALALQADGRVQRAVHTKLLTRSDSTYPELAGALAAIIGSLFTLIITAATAIPVGVLAAVYLEEFAPKNRLTDFIEVNINNLAAVPSIVFGLLGLAVFLNVFGLPRSAPLAGGLVLALMTIPVVIIASRAALKSVPPSIRSGALAVGASKVQSVFHHVLPLAAPGIFTGSILGLARALGETAPLLLIGMVAFVNRPPATPTDPATVLPVLIYSWSDRAERAWEPMTAAVIVILMVFLILMNAAVVYLRRKFERRW